MTSPERELALSLAEGRAPSPKEIARVAAHVGDEAARWAFNQWALRGRAAAKFARAGEMLLTRDGLEMASHERVAAFHAELLWGLCSAPAEDRPGGPPSFGEGGPVPSGPGFLDATCGVGADSIALARLGPTVASDIDPAHVEAARRNLAVHGLAADVQGVDCITLDWSPYAVMVDPQRRTRQGRTLDPGVFSPPLDLVVAKCRKARCAVVKLSPMLPDDLLSQGDGLVFVSHRGECGEALVLFGAASGRRAYHVESGAWLDARPLALTTAEPEAFVAEADPAAVRAHALGGLGWAGLGDSNGYLTGGEPRPSPWLAWFRALWHGPFREDKLKGAVRDLGLAVEAVKKRGVDIEPERLRKKLPAGGEKPAVVLFYKAGKSVRAVIAERCP